MKKLTSSSDYKNFGCYFIFIYKNQNAEAKNDPIVDKLIDILETDPSQLVRAKVTE
jgi:hypothetical protein